MSVHNPVILDSYDEFIRVC